MKSKSTKSRNKKSTRLYKLLSAPGISWLKEKYDNRASVGIVPTMRSNLRRSIGIIGRYWKAILLNTVVYGVLYFVFVRVLTAVNIEELQNSVRLVFGDGQDSFTTQVLTVGTLFGESTNFNSQTGLLFGIVTIVSALAMIWVLRHIWGEKRVSVREAFYQGMYPLIPFTLVLLFMIIQLIPFSLSAFIFQTAFNNGLTVTLIEKIFFVSVFATGTIISAYFLIGSIIGLYAVTVPGVTPSQARKTAKRVLKGRRFLVLKQVILFMILTGFLATAPMLLVVWLVPNIAIIAAAVMIVLGLPWFNLYFYGLYRDLLDE